MIRIKEGPKFCSHTLQKMSFKMISLAITLVVTFIHKRV